MSDYLIPARPTTYRGIEMRSRFEARFAAFLDDSEVSWEYEPRAFADQSGQYLPDFRVAGFAYVEVRPTTELAERACRPMEIIWASEPDAFLYVVIPGEDRSLSRRPYDAEWRWGPGF